MDEPNRLESRSPNEVGSSKPVSVSVIVHTRDEEGQVADCLASCVGWADEVVVADMESRDRTRSIAGALGCRVLEVPYMEEFDSARNFSAAVASNAWILYLDADERLTSDVKVTIERLIQDAQDDVGGFQIPYKVVSFGRWIRHAGGWWPSYKSPALLRKGRFRFPGGVHEPAIVDGQVVRVEPKSPEDAIVHLSHPDLDRYFAKLNRYTTLEVLKRTRAGRTPSWHSVADGLGGVFRWYYDDTQGKSDGLAGFLLSLGSGMYEAAVGMKHMEALGPTEVPASAQEFFQRALEAARTPSPPEKTAGWTEALAQWMTSRRSHPAAGATCCVIGDLDDRDLHLDDLPDGSFVLLRSKEDCDDTVCRVRVQTMLGAAAHCLIIDGGADVWWFGWKDGAQRSGPRVCSLTHANALRMMGGGEVQLFQSVKSLRKLGIVSDVKVGGDMPAGYDLCHVYSLHHPEPPKESSPYVLSPIFWDRSELAWAAPKVASLFSRLDDSEDVDAGYLALQSASAKRDSAATQKLDESCLRLIQGAKAVMPNASCELNTLRRTSGLPIPNLRIVPNAYVPCSGSDVDESLLPETPFVLCVGRIEHNKNQLSLVWALRDSKYKIVLIGTEHDAGYTDLCRGIGGDRVTFLGAQPPASVHAAMRRAVAHCLPSFGETPGIANLEAASLGCPIVVGDRAAEREYFGEGARYVDPLDPVGIREAVEEAAVSRGSEKVRELQDRVVTTYTWEAVAASLAEVYRDVLSSP